MKTQILKLLRERESYVSGQDICGKLSVSRTAVWKVIGQLRDQGYEIEAAQKKGYLLVSSPDILTEEEISSRLTTAWAARPVVAYEKIDSTNNEAKRLAESGATHGTLVIAEEQDFGKGRRGRAWDSPKGSGIWMTLLLKPDFPPAQASMLTIVAAMAVEEGIRKVTGLTPGIKWPNDVVIGGKKVCGILTEMSTEPDYINHIVLGIGINVNISEFPEEIKDRATSLFLEYGEKISRAELTAAIWSAFEVYYDRFIQSGNLSLLKSEYESRLVNMDNKVRVLDPKGEWEGISRGVDDFGRLLVEREIVDDSEDESQDEPPISTVRTAETETKKRKTKTEVVDSGEVSVRGVYGYV